MVASVKRSAKTIRPASRAGRMTSWMFWAREAKYSNNSEIGSQVGVSGVQQQLSDLEPDPRTAWFLSDDNRMPLAG